MPNSKQYDLEERTYEFAKDTRFLIKRLPRTLANTQDAAQVIRSSGSVHANYIEANEALSKKDYYHRVKICRKEAKESHSWLRLLEVGTDAETVTLREKLVREATELTHILGSIISKGTRSTV